MSRNQHNLGSSLVLVRLQCGCIDGTRFRGRTSQCVWGQGLLPLNVSAIIQKDGECVCRTGLIKSSMWIVCLVNDPDQHTVSTWNEVPHLPLWQLTVYVYQMINFFTATSEIYGEQLRTVNTESVIPDSSKNMATRIKWWQSTFLQTTDHHCF